MDYFTSLSSLDLFTVMPTELLDKASEYRSVGQTVTYYFDSEKYSRPHRVSLNGKHELQEIALTIPKNQVSAYQQKLQNLGQPEAIKSIGEQEVILAFPSKGISFEVDAAQQPVEIVMFKPTAAQNFLAEKLDPTRVLNSGIVQPTQVVEPHLFALSGNNANVFWQYGLITVLLVLIFALLWVYFRRLKGRRPTDDQLN